ncbi:hypothetical protein ACFC66_31725 [Streptomyces bacillaris]|uniref:hypothetical protein n=1 Tax=Streptomyces bacillaris TaxID=68179 RepID=UPI0035DBA712
MRLKYVAAIATAAAMAPAFFGTTPAAAGEAPEAATTAPDLASAKEVGDPSDNAAAGSELPADEAARPVMEPRSPVAGEPVAQPSATERSVASAPASHLPPPAAEEGLPGRETADATQTQAQTQDETSTEAERDRPAPELEEGPDSPVEARLRGVPLKIPHPPFTSEPGAKWTEFNTLLDNSEGIAGDDAAYDLTITISPGLVPEGEVHEGDFELQYFHDGAWHDAELTYQPVARGSLQTTFPGNSLPAELVTSRFRFRVSTSVCLEGAHFNASALFYVPTTGKIFGRTNRGFQTKFTFPGGGEEPGEGEKPGGEKPGEGEEPGNSEEPGNGQDPGDGSEGQEAPGAGSSGAGEAAGGSGSGGPASVPVEETVRAGSGSPAVTDVGFAGDREHGSRPKGTLAQTGSDAATRWTLGTGGAALALGAALVAGTGRHRRRQAAERP